MNAPDARPRVLLVEDDAPLAAMVAEYLSGQGFAVKVESRGDRAEQRIVEERPDAVVLDLGLPGQDGLTVCRRVRERYSGPILMVTARGDDADEVVGLELGADGYLPKPVSPRVLLAHLRSLLRRRGGEPSPAPERVRAQDVELDRSTFTCTVGERPVELTRAEFDLLWLLVENAGRVMDRQALLEKLRREDYDGIDRSMDMRVSKLRSKLGDDPKTPRLIRTLRGVGYLFVRDPRAGR